MAEPGVSYEDYSAAARRLLSGESQEGSPAYVNDSNIFRQGDATHGARLAAEMQPPPEQGAPNANSVGNVATRAVTSGLPQVAIPSMLAHAANAIAGLAERTGIAQPFTPQEIPADATPETRAFIERNNARGGRLPILSQEIRSKLRDVTGGAVGQEMPADAGPLQQMGEGVLAATAGGGGLSAIKAGAQGIGAGLGNFLSNTVVPTVGGYYGGKAGEAVGGDVGGLIGSTVGAVAAPMVGPAVTRAGEALYARGAAPNAAQVAQDAKDMGVPLSAGMVGNENVKSLERRLGGQRGSEGVVTGARERSAQGVINAADQTAAARGAVTPQPEPGMIGADIINAADTARQNLESKVGTVQSNLMSRVGADTQVPISDLINTMRGTVVDPKTGQALTDAPSSQPVLSRIEQLQQMQNPQGTVRYDALKDFRSNQGRTLQTQPPVPGRFADQVYGATTDAMRNAAEQRGVPPADFNAAQDITRRIEGSGGPLPYFRRIAGEPGTSGNQTGGMTPQQAFTTVIRRGEQSPQQIQPFETFAERPAYDQIMGDALRQRMQSTLESNKATGMGNFANWWNNLTPAAQRMFGDKVQGDVQKVANLAGALDYGTSQRGLTKAVGGQLGDMGARLTVAGMLGDLAKASGIPGAGTAAHLAGYFGLYPAISMIRAKMLESPMAMRGMTGDFTPVAPSGGSLGASLAAANVAAQRYPQQ